jgi:cephalosporin-C deacetylase-like acetyl esterase
MWNGMLAAILILVSVGVAGAAELPYAVLPVAQARAYPLLTADGADLGTAALAWTKQHLVIEAQVRDATPVSLADAGVGIEEAYLADSVEFWIGRHQFVAATTPKGGQLWDYLYCELVPGAEVAAEEADDGYQLRIRVPWTAVLCSSGSPCTAGAAHPLLTKRSAQFPPQGVRSPPCTSLSDSTAPSLLPGLCFPFLLQINDRQRVQDGERWKDSGRQLCFPCTATWDRVSTYGTVCLATGPVPGAATAPAPFASLDIRTYAYAKQAEAVVRRAPAFADSALRLVCRAPDGTVLSDQPVSAPSTSSGQAGAGEMLLNLAWNEKQAGICTAELWLEADDKRFGPIAEPYFCAGQTTIAEYRSPRQAPADLAAFWERKLAAMRARPMHATVTEIESERPDVIVEKVTVDNHRGNPMIVWVSRKRTDTGARPAHLNVYPPMRAATHVWPQGGRLGITFCGSLQGECRRPGQTTNEGLWARAETLDDCYWLDVVLDGVRAMDYVATRPDSDGRTIVSGGSRGGWYSLALAAIAPDRVALARFASPCYSDVTMNQRLGYGSAATEIYTTFERDRVRTGGQVFANFRYFDPLFLAELIRTPVVFSAGLQDTICSAIGMTAAAHRMPKAFCTFVLDPEGGHGGSPWMGPITRLAEELSGKIEEGIGQRDVRQKND